MVLLTVTIFSTALAALTSVMAWQLSRREARRSEARVAALAAAIHGQDPVGVETSDAFTDFPSEHPGAFAAERPVANQTGYRFLAMASVGTLVVAGLLVLAVTTQRGGTALEDGAAGAATIASAQPATAAAAPLELMALTHERANDGLIVRGAIRNPSNGTVCDVPAVVVLTFDERGVFLGSSESAASGEVLPPGARASFSVNIPATSTTPARYRVSFRSAGRVVPHVDRRVPEAGAAGRIDHATKAQDARQVQS